VSLRLRLLLVLLAIYSAGGYYLTSRALEQVRPRYLESIEESLVDTSALLAAFVETELKDGRMDVTALRKAVTVAQNRGFEARVFTLRKTEIDLRVYVTDAAGLVVFDSTGRDEGKDYSRWNDVLRTLRGEYGARSTRDTPGDDNTQVIYVAAPIRHEGRVVGVLTSGKPTRGINELVAVARQKLISGAAIGGMVVLVLLLLVASWIIAPLERLTAYARTVRDGRAAPLPPLPGHTLRDLGTAFEEMRDALEGRQHVERYTQTLAHEVKAPLAAIRGAAELLDETMPPEQRQKFLANIRNEAARIQRIIERLLELSSLEARKQLRQTESITAARLAEDAADVMRPAGAARGISLIVGGGEAATVRGEAVLLREALINLLQNAVEFSPSGGAVTLDWSVVRGRIVFQVVDNGPGVPDYALPRVFERFYSLPRPGTERKSTGLGLALVREIAHLHGGDAALENRPEGGARATLWLPAEKSS
jgi:two-component system sensor histidine kinase CreC